MIHSSVLAREIVRNSSYEMGRRMMMLAFMNHLLSDPDVTPAMYNEYNHRKMQLQQKEEEYEIVFSRLRNRFPMLFVTDPELAAFLKTP